VKKFLFILVGSLLIWILLVSSVGAWSGRGSSVVLADSGTPTPPPARSTTIKVSFTLYEWWLIRWSNNQVVCQMWVEHDGIPIPAEVNYFCGESILNQWLATKPCTTSNYSQCTGFYLNREYKTPGERTVVVKLAPPTVGVSIAGCDISPQKNYCDTLPTLVFTGQEPLPDEQIIRIQGTMDGQAFSCPGSVCDLPIPPTGQDGISIEFWADSSFGDASDHFTAQVRTIPWGNFTSPDGSATDVTKWYVDVISPQWTGAPLASCSQTWSSFPPVGGSPTWLTTPKDPSQLISYGSYYYLAGSLIEQSVVDASDCPNNGLQSQGLANECGLEKAQPAVQSWQNQFDTDIINVANETNVPAQLMKNVFGRESQFWPGIFLTNNEVGLGQLTDNGADTALLWNSDFFSQFCPLVFKTQACQGGYGNLTADQQAILRGAMLNKVNAACQDCPTGIDLTKANFSISIFARSLLANCNQVGQIISNTTNKQPGNVSSYEDLWKFTLVNYNAGPGCLIDALKTTLQKGQALNWQNVSSNLETGCRGAIDYVNDINQGLAASEPGPTPTPQVSGTPPANTPIPTTAPTQIPSPTPTGTTTTG
jgi:hypothetical protein